MVVDDDVCPGEFTITLNNIETSFPYQVSIGAARSAQFQVDVIRPVRVARVDVRYEYPRGVGLPPQTEDDTGDIYAPAGTTAHLTITTDKPVKHGQLTLSDGAVVALAGDDTVLSAALNWLASKFRLDVKVFPPVGYSWK